jgi:hypothetical protein
MRLLTANDIENEDDDENEDDRRGLLFFYDTDTDN